MEKLLKARFIQEYDKDDTKDALHMSTENEPTVLNLPGGLHTVEGNDKIPDNSKNPLATIQAAENQKQTNAGSLAKLLNPLNANVALI